MTDRTWAPEVVDAVAAGIEDMGVDEPVRYLARAAIEASPLGEAVALIERVTADLAAMCARAKQQEHWDIQPDGHAQDLAAGEASARDAAAFVARVREG